MTDPDRTYTAAREHVDAGGPCGFSSLCEEMATHVLQTPDGFVPACEACAALLDRLGKL